MKNKANQQTIEFPEPQFGVRYIFSDGSSFQDDLYFPEIEVAELFAEVEKEFMNISFAESGNSDVMILRFEIIPLVVCLIH